MQRTVEKVAVFITRAAAGGAEILLFQHPNAGIQIPAGTVEPGETPAAAAAREGAEETGLANLPPGRWLDSHAEALPASQRVVYETARVYARPDAGSFGWASIRRGIQVECLRPGPVFTQIRYIEWDAQASPPYVSYQITGWMPSAALAERRTRHFFHIRYHGLTAERWVAATDGQRFQLFWAPLAQLPAIAPPQDRWIDVLLRGSASA